MKLTYWLKGDKLTKDVNEANFMLSNKKGGYLYLAPKPSSKSQGFFINDDFRMFKLIEAIRLPLEATSITNKFSSVTREYGKKAMEEFTLPYSHNSFIYEISGYNGPIGIDLDCRESSDSDDWGRFYNIHIEKDFIVITYEKQSSYKLFLVIRGKNIKAEKVKEWKKIEYEYDKIRNSDFMANVFTALNLYIEADTRLVFTASTDRDRAVAESDYVYRNMNKLKRKQLNSLIYKYIPGTKERRLAYNAALNSLNGLLVDINNSKGIFAGLPGLFQFWSRNELLCLNGLNKKDSAEILLKYLPLVQEGIPSRHPHSPYASIDSIGWFYHRLNAKDKLDIALNALKAHENHEGLVVNGPKETWMDTIDRSGARIEMQCLKLNMLKLYGNPIAEQDFREKVRKAFWDGKSLSDGVDDATIRPNAFLAHYAYPELLSNDEWKKCFKKQVQALWLPWGGFSTLDKGSKLFCPEHTGENAKSCHNGDSWHFLNSVAAMAMLSVDRKFFKKNIDKILEASVNDLLWAGLKGHHSESSSSKKQPAERALSSAMSSAMFIELVNNLH